MEFPVLEAIPVRGREIRKFGGYCRRDAVAAGAFYDMENMTGDRYPLLSPRSGRGVLSARNPGLWNPAKSRPQALAELDGLCVLSDGILYFDQVGGEFQSADLQLSAEEPKQLIPFGTCLIVLPDKKYIDLRQPQVWGSLEARFAPEGEISLKCCLCSREGKVYEAQEADTAPLEPADGALWLDTSGYLSGGKSRLMQYSLAQEKWKELGPVYLRLEAAGIGAGFRAGDWIFVEGLEDASLRDVSGKAKAVVAAAADYLVLDQAMGKAQLELNASGLILERRMPEMDLLFACDNRLWGCRYGLDEAGNFINRIYASKLGDMKNWYAFGGDDTDSFVADCSAYGPWTGAIHALGQPLFFKESSIHRVYGDGARNFRIQSLACRGVQEGSHKSLAVVNGLLYYKATDGVVVYDGSLPETVSQDLGEAAYYGGVAAALGNKYYIRMADGDGKARLFCYDTARRFWHREEDTPITQLCTAKNVLYYIQEGEPLVGILAGGTAVEQRVKWYAETGLLDGGDGQQCYLRRITARLSMETGTAVRFLVQYDSRGPWQCLAGVTGRGAGTVSVPLRLRRADHLRLRIEGEGPALIYGLFLEQAGGGYGRRGVE